MTSVRPDLIKTSDNYERFGSISGVVRVKGHFENFLMQNAGIGIIR